MEEFSVRNLSCTRLSRSYFPGIGNFFKHLYGVRRIGTRTSIA